METVGFWEKITTLWHNSWFMSKSINPFKVKHYREFKFHFVTLSMLTAMKEWHLVCHVTNFCTSSEKWCNVSDLDMEVLNGISLLCVKTNVCIHDPGTPHSTLSCEVKPRAVNQTMVYLHNTIKQLKCMLYLKKYSNFLKNLRN